MLSEPVPVLFKQVVPVPSVMPSILVVTVPSQIMPAVAADYRRKVILPDMVPWPVVVPPIVP
jgi:hypothetical protein